MKFCYCPACKELHPKNWHSRGRCERCDQECIVFRVRRSFWGMAMYLLDAVAAALLILDVAYYQNGQQWASFISAIPDGTLLAIVFVLIFASFAFMYIDLGKMTEEAKRRVASGKLAVVRSDAPDKKL